MKASRLSFGDEPGKPQDRVSRVPVRTVDLKSFVETTKTRRDSLLECGLTDKEFPSLWVGTRPVLVLESPVTPT